MKRRTFLGLGLGAVGLACGGGTGSQSEGGGGPLAGLTGARKGGGDSKAAIAAASKFALLPDVPGFQVVGTMTSAGTAPVLVQMRMNINDFMRPEQEAAAVLAWMDDAARYGMDTVELSFTGHVLQAFVDHAPELLDRVRKDRPTILEHYRALKDRKKQSTLAELYYTEPTTMEIDRSRYGPLVLIQKTFGVTPVSEGGTLGELLRADWQKASGQRDLEAQGFDQLDRNSMIAHPDRVIGWSLPNIDDYGGSEQIESFFRIRRLEAQVGAGQQFDASDLDERLTDIKRWAQVTQEMGFDLDAIAGLSDLVHFPKTRGIGVGVMGTRASESELQAMNGRASKDRAGLVADMQRVMEELAARTSSLPTLQDEVAFKLSRLDPQKVYATRFAWHGSNDYTVQPWGDRMYGERGTFPYPMRAADTRPQDQQDAIVAARVGVLQAFADSGRVRAASLENSTQYEQQNSPEAGYPDVLGVSFADVPGALDPDRIDSLASSKGLSASYESGRGKTGKSGGGGSGSAGGSGGAGDGSRFGGKGGKTGGGGKGGGGKTGGGKRGKGQE